MTPTDLEFEYDQETIYEEVENLFRKKPASASTVGPDDNSLINLNNYTKSEFLKHSSSSDTNGLKSYNASSVLSSTKMGKNNNSYNTTEKEGFVTYVVDDVKQVPSQTDKVADSVKQNYVHGIREELDKSEKLSAKVVPTPTAKKPPVRKQSVSINFYKYVIFYV